MKGTDEARRKLLVGGGALMGAIAMAGAGFGQPEQGGASAAGQTWSGKPQSPTALQGKVAVITGAARGIGRAIAVDMAANGADIVGIDICGKITPVQEYDSSTRADLDETGKLVQARGRKWMPAVGDVRDLKFLRQTAGEAEQHMGHIDIVVANAATQVFRPLIEMEDAHWHDVIDTNLNGTANTIRAFAPKLVKQGQGRIIVLSSMQGKHGTKNGSSYSASKWGIIGLMKSAALELGQHKITVNALIPGLVDTPLTRNAKRWSEMIGELTGDPSPPKNPTEEQVKGLRAKFEPLKVGWLQPEDLAPAAVFLASDAAAMVTGACYDVTGGDDAKNQS